jgi:hypothetical protein
LSKHLDALTLNLKTIKCLNKKGLSYLKSEQVGADTHTGMCTHTGRCTYLYTYSAAKKLLIANFDI